MTFIATINGKQYDNTDNGALFPEKEREGYLAGTFNDGRTQRVLGLIAKADPESKTYKLGLVLDGQIVERGVLRIAAGSGRVHYEGNLGDTWIVGFKAQRNKATYIQIRPDNRRNIESQVNAARDAFDDL